MKSEKGGERRGGKEREESIHSLLHVYMALSVPLSIFL